MNFMVPTPENSNLLTSLPQELHYTGEPTEWTKVTRPGLRLHSFLEGLVIDRRGYFFVTDVPHGRIFEVSPDGLLWRDVFKYDGEPHGLALLPDGQLVIADYRKGLLIADLESKTYSVFCDRFNTENFRGLSDLVQDNDGAIWFTDSGRSSLSDPTGRLFRLSKDLVLRCVLNNIPYPNGVAVSADGTQLLVAVTRANAVWKLARNLPPNGKPMVGNYLQLNGGLGPDGLAVSCDGILAVAHAQAGRVWLFNSVGQLLAQVGTPGGMWTTSVRFSQDGKTLFIVDAQTASIFKYNLKD